MWTIILLFGTKEKTRRKELLAAEQFGFKGKHQLQLLRITEQIPEGKDLEC